MNKMKLLNINIEIEILVTENDIKNWLKLTQYIGMSGYIAFVDATQKYKKIKLLNRNIDLENEVTENEIKMKGKFK